MSERRDRFSKLWLLPDFVFEVIASLNYPHKYLAKQDQKEPVNAAHAANVTDLKTDQRGKD